MTNSSIDEKLQNAGLSSLDINNPKKLIRIAQVLMKSSSGQTEYIINKLCAVNPYIAAECIVDSSCFEDFKSTIINATICSDIPQLLKMLIYYRFNMFDEYNEKIDVIYFDSLDVNCLFRSWKELCGFIVASINRFNPNNEWIKKIIDQLKISVSNIYQNRNDSKTLFDSLLTHKYYESVYAIYSSIGIDNYYAITNHKYEDIYMIFGNDLKDIQEQMKYCWIDGINRKVNLFDCYHKCNPLIKENLPAYCTSLLYEYQITNDADGGFKTRYDGVMSNGDIISLMKGSTEWRVVYTENLIACTMKCLQEFRDAQILLDLFEHISIFDFKKTMALGIDIIEKEGILIDERQAKKDFISYVIQTKSINSIKLYLNSFLKVIMTIDDAISIVYNAVDKDIFDDYLKSSMFPAKVSFKDSAELVIRLVNLSSRAYTIYRDMVLCEDYSKGDSIYVRFRYSEEDGLFVDNIGYGNEENVESTDYKRVAQECISIINNIAISECSDQELEKLNSKSYIPMHYVKMYFEDFLSSLRKVHDVIAFMRVIISLNWNRKYFYVIGKEYDHEDFIFFSKYNALALTLLREKVQYGLSEVNLVQLYMNSFFKLIISPDELDLTSNSVDILFDRYVFVINQASPRGAICMSAKRFTKWGIVSYAEEKKYLTLREGIYRIEKLNDIIGLSFCKEETDKLVVPKSIDRMLRAYDTIGRKSHPRKYEFEYINRVSTDFYFDDNYACRCVSNALIKATNLRARYFDQMKDLIKELGDSNIYGSRFYPLINHKKISRFSSIIESNDYKQAIRTCQLFAKSCKHVSEAIYLYINTYVKNKVSFREYIKICRDNSLSEDDYSGTMIIVVEVRKTDNKLRVNCIDVSVDGVGETVFDAQDILTNGRYYALLKISYANEYFCYIQKIIGLDKKTVYYEV